jgi:NADH-quinone oxidoreductase subunit A
VSAEFVQAAGSASPYGAWLSVAVVGALATAVVGGALLVVRLITRVVDRIRDPSERLTTYECGEAPVGSAWFRFNNRFTTVALTFLVFDVELALLWPILPRCLHWVGAGRGQVVFGEIAAFAGVLALGLFWVARMGGFVWDRTVEGATPAPIAGPSSRPEELDVVA